MIVVLPPHILRAARAILNLSQEDCARAAGLSVKSVAQAESPRGSSARTVEKLRSLYESMGIEFMASSVTRSGLDGAGLRIKPSGDNGHDQWFVV